MYHFKSTDHAPETTVLNEHTELSGRAVKFLKDFQISAVRFLFEQFCKRDFSILNDESGLGKTAPVAVFLGIVAARKKCLIVVANNDECIWGWRFHLDILTDLKVNILNEEKDYDATAFSVYIVKWNTLRTFSDMGKFNFDMIIVDNREQILNNAFCISTLLKNYEKKVQIVISSMDVTADVKLLHNILRLGGRLEHQYETFKAFELKFQLPDLKAISAKKSDLEDYFMKREILNDYCRNFRLRRYRYQYENALPLVEPERYKAFLMEWQQAEQQKFSKNYARLAIDEQPLSFEMDTEELLAPYQSIKATPQKYDGSLNALAPNTPTDVADDLMDMPPLIFVTDSEDEADEEEQEEEDVIFLSSESAAAAAAAMPVIEILEETETVAEKQTPQKSKQLKNVKIEKITPPPRPAAISPSPSKQIPNESTAKVHLDDSMTTRQKNKRKSTTPQHRTPQAAQKDSPKTSRKTPNQNMERDVQETTIRTRRSNAGINKKYHSSPMKQFKNSKDSKTPKATANKQTPAKSKAKTAELKSTTPQALKESPKSPTKVKLEAAANSPPPPRIHLRNQTLKVEPPSPLKSKADNATHSKVIEPNVGAKTKTNTSKTPVESRRERERRRVSTPLANAGVPLRETRNTQRNTRSSGGKRKCFMLDFDDDNSRRAKTKAKPKQAAEKLQTTKRKGENKTATPPTTTKKNQKKENQAEKPEKDAKTAKATTSQNKSKLVEIATAPLAATAAALPNSPPQNSTQSSILPNSSECEEIQCGQRLVYSSSTDNTPPLAPAAAVAVAATTLAKPKNVEFLKPSTPPPSFRSLGATASNFNDSDSDVAIVLQPRQQRRSQINRKTKNQNPNASVVVLSSSHDEDDDDEDEETLHSSQMSSLDVVVHQRQQQRQRQRRALSNVAVASTRKRQRASLPTNLNNSKNKFTFGELLAKQREKTKSPDLFSLGSDVGGGDGGGGGGGGGVISSNLPFSQSANSGALKSSQAVAAAAATSPIFGFKIFGSEVRGFQSPISSLKVNQMAALSLSPVAATTAPAPATIAATTATAKTRSKRNASSCLHILDQMFENDEIATTTTTKKTTTKTAAKTSKKTDNSKDNNEKRNQQKSKEKRKSSRKSDMSVDEELKTFEEPLPRKPIHESQKQQQQQQRQPQQAINESLDIFEITNNATFGSTLRLSASGHISPVTIIPITTITNNINNNLQQQQQNGNFNNKITNYLIGSGCGSGDQLLATPKKPSQQQQQLQQQQQHQQPTTSGGGHQSTLLNATQNHQRKSPKSAKSTQATKLTKWFRRSSSVDEGTFNRTTRTPAAAAATSLITAATTPAAAPNAHENAASLRKSAKLVKRRRLDLTTS